MVQFVQRRILRMIGFLYTLGLTIGCMFNFAPSTPTPIPAPPSATPNAEAADWQTLAPGIEIRTYVPNEVTLSQLLVLRIDPTRYTFRAHYRPGEPLSASGWRTELPEAAAFINANFFDRENRVLGLLVADGVVYGTPYTDRGGLFFIQDGQPAIRSNIDEPYRGEVLEQAVQAFPMLVLDGAQAYNTLRGDRPTRRTVIAQDQQGRILLMATPLVGLRLADLSAYLVTTDLTIVNAFNLDGGGSTMMFAQSDESYVITSFDRVPVVLAVYAR